MAKITRQTYFPFAAGAPTDDVEAFGSTAVGSPDYTKDIPTIQTPAAWNTGWRAALLSGLAPTLQDQNAVHYVHGQMLGYILQQGVAEWDSGTTYFVGTLVTNPGTGDVYVSIQNNNLNNAISNLTNNAWWEYKNTSVSKDCRYNTTAAPVIGTSYGTVTFGTREYDQYTLFNGTVFTAPIPGIYSVTYNLLLSTVTLSTTQGFFAQVLQNGSTLVQQEFKNGNGGSSVNYILNGRVDIGMSINDTIEVQAKCSVATALQAVAGANWITVTRVCN